MKFKTYNGNVNDLIENKVIAPIDNKNVMQDWIYDDLMDVSACNKNECLGYVDGEALRAIWVNNVLMLKPLNGISDRTEAIVLGRMSEILNYDEEDKEDDTELIAICKSDRATRAWYVSFFFGRYTGK